MRSQSGHKLLESHKRSFRTKIPMMMASTEASTRTGAFMVKRNVGSAPLVVDSVVVSSNLANVKRYALCARKSDVGARITQRKKDDNLSNDSTETRVSMTRKFTNVLLSSKAWTRTRRKITSNSLMDCNVLTMITHLPDL